MTDDRKSGTALIAGSLGGILAMAIHPTGAASATAGQTEHLALVSGIAHSIAIVSFLPGAQLVHAPAPTQGSPGPTRESAAS